MIKYLKLFRWPNLLMIVLTQVLVRCCLIIPAFKAEYFITEIFPRHLSQADFILLVLSTVLIAAGGYAINDYFDVNIDRINKPGKNIVGEPITKSTAKVLFYVLSSVGIIIGSYLAIKIGKPVMGMIHLFASFSLWIYSSQFKKKMFSGNVIIALLCALSVLLPGLYEPEFYRNFIYITWFAVMAFMFSLIREIIKDMEDVEGDIAGQCQTLPIVFGTGVTKKIIYALIMLTASYICWIIYKHFQTNNVISFWYLIGMFLIPIAGLFYLVLSAKVKMDYHYASVYAKLILLGGVFSILPFWYFFLR